MVSGRWVGGSVLDGSVVGSFNKTPLSITNLQIVFIQILIFHHYRMGNQYKKIDKKTVVTKLREAKLKMTNHDVNKSN